jgi:hypothetical protein
VKRKEFSLLSDGLASEWCSSRPVDGPRPAGGAGRANGKPAGATPVSGADGSRFFSSFDDLEVHDIETLAHDVLVRLSCEWVVCVPTPDRHVREAFRAEVLRLARQWGLHIRMSAHLDLGLADFLCKRPRG